MISKIELRREIEKLEQQRPKTLNEFNNREVKIRNLLDQLRAREREERD